MAAPHIQQLRRRLSNRYILSSYAGLHVNPAIQIIENFNNEGSDETDASPYSDSEDSDLVAEAKKTVPDPTTFDYTERDVILYNLGVGAEATELQWVYENDDNFSALPTFGVIPQFEASSGVPFDWLPNFNPVSNF